MSLPDYPLEAPQRQSGDQGKAEAELIAKTHITCKKVNATLYSTIQAHRVTPFAASELSKKHMPLNRTSGACRTAR